jgi:hypothetical protein
VSAEETRCSAKGNMLSGKANHSTPSSATPAQSDRATGLRAAGTSARVANPTMIRTKAIPLSRYDRGRATQEGLQLGFAAVDADEIRRGVRELAIALEGKRATAGSLAAGHPRPPT